MYKFLQTVSTCGGSTYLFFIRTYMHLQYIWRWALFVM